MIGMSRWRREAVALTNVCLLGTTSCMHLPRHRYASVRLREYFEEHPEVPTKVSVAMENGHVLLGMDEAQVWAVLGDPVRRTGFGATSPVHVWLYPAHRLHQDQMRSHGTQLFRLVFVEGRLSLIEPI